MAEESIADILKDYIPRADYEAALESLTETITERDSLRGDHDAASKRVAELEGKVRSRALRDVYDKAADELKIDPKFRDAAFKLAELKADGDEPDAKAIKAQLTEFLKGDSGKHFVSAEPERAKLVKADGGRGPSVHPGQPELRVTRANLRDAVFMRDNQKEIHAARAAGLLTVDD